MVNGERELGPEQKLASLGVPEKNIAHSIAILSRVSTIRDLNGEFRSRHFTCDAEQFLLPMFRPLYTKNPEIKEAVLERLSGLGISEEVIEEYFTEYDNQPYVLLHFRHEEIDSETKDTFIEATRITMLHTLRIHLGFEKPYEYFLQLAQTAPKVENDDERVVTYLEAVARGEKVRSPHRHLSPQSK